MENFTCAMIATDKRSNPEYKNQIEQALHLKIKEYLDEEFFVVLFT